MNVEPRHAPRISTTAFLIGAAVLALVIACAVSLLASAAPDGLEYVAHSQGFLDTAYDSAVAGGPFADYATSFVSSPQLSTIVAGAVGCLVTFAVAWTIGVVVRRRNNA